MLPAMSPRMLPIIFFSLYRNKGTEINEYESIIAGLFHKYSDKSMRIAIFVIF